MKYAVYVEGLSEMLFVADVLQKYSNYDPAQCGFLCVNLNANNYDRLSNPKQGDVNSTNNYQIVNVNINNRGRAGDSNNKGPKGSAVPWHPCKIEGVGSICKATSTTYRTRQGNNTTCKVVCQEPVP